MLVRDNDADGDDGFVPETEEEAELAAQAQLAVQAYLAEAGLVSRPVPEPSQSVTAAALDVAATAAGPGAPPAAPLATALPIAVKMASATASKQPKAGAVGFVSHAEWAPATPFVSYEPAGASARAWAPLRAIDSSRGTTPGPRDASSSLASRIAARRKDSFRRRESRAMEAPTVAMAPAVTVAMPPFMIAAV